MNSSRTSCPSHPRQALFGYLQDREEFRDGDAGVAADKMDYPVMGAAETVLGENGIGFAVKSR